ncbi:MAG TPA: phytanoyl-CoA dioxygenase family protein [Mycobacteriales bacterium]|nr:phytanoyl-CoA dioxygenase family protein [Mycobacteriales bacterium]
MQTQVTEEQIAFYQENGYIVIPDVLTPDELQTWRAVVDEAVAERGEKTFADATGLNAKRPEIPDGHDEDTEFYNSVFTQRVNLWQTNEKMRHLMWDEQLGKMIADLARVDGIRIWHDQALIKQPYANYTAFHLDVPYWSFTSPDAISIWFALDDAKLENGCLYYVPGSHKAQKYDNCGITQNLGALFEVYPEWKDIAPVACPVPAGGVCIHNGLTAHGAGANMTPGLRRAMTCAYMPDGSTFNGQPNVLPPSYMQTLKVGDVLEDDRHNPLIFSRSKKAVTV